MGVEYILSKAINIPEQFPFWSKVISPTYVTVSVAASTGIWETIVPTTTETWMIMVRRSTFDTISVNYENNGENALNSYKARVYYQVYDSVSAAYKSSAFAAWALSGYIRYDELQVPMLVASGVARVAIYFYNGNTVAEPGGYMFYGFVLGTRKLKIKEKIKKKRPQKKHLILEKLSSDEVSITELQYLQKCPALKEILKGCAVKIDDGKLFASKSKAIDVLVDEDTGKPFVRRKMFFCINDAVKNANSKGVHAAADLHKIDLSEIEKNWTDIKAEIDTLCSLRKENTTMEVTK